MSQFITELTLKLDGRPVTFDLTEIYKVEARVIDTQNVTSKAKGQELAALFNDAHLKLITLIGKARLAEREAEKKANAIRSRIVLDEAKDILKAKGLAKDSNPAGSADLRDAILDGSTEYQAALDDVAMVEAAIELLQGKADSIKMAHFSARGASDEAETQGRDTRLNGTTETATQQPKFEKRGFSTPKI